MKRGFDHRLLPPYRVIKESDIEHNAVLSDVVSMKEHPDDTEDSQKPQESPIDGFEPLPVGGAEDDRKWLLPEPELPSRAITLSRGTYERIVSP